MFLGQALIGDHETPPLHKKGGIAMDDTLDRICADCAHCFPDRVGWSDYGICILDPVFEPFEDDIVQCRFERCQKIVDAKRFDINQEACPDFQPIEILDESKTAEIEDLLGMSFGDSSLEEIEDSKTILTFEDGGTNYRVDFSELPVEAHVKDLNSPLRKQREAAITSLGALLSLGNAKAKAPLLDYFKGLGPPSTLDEVHFKIFVLSQFKGPETSQELAEILLSDLEQTPSNNTTRQWITALLEHLFKAPLHWVEPRLRDLIRKGLFSYRLKKRIESMLDQMWKDSEFEGRLKFAK